MKAQSYKKKCDFQIKRDFQTFALFHMENCQILYQICKVCFWKMSALNNNVIHNVLLMSNY